MTGPGRPPESFVRTTVRPLTAYGPPRDPAAVGLHLNEAPFDLPEELKRELGARIIQVGLRHNYVPARDSLNPERPIRQVQGCFEEGDGLLKQLQRQPPSACPHRRTDADLPLPPVRPRQQQVRHVRTRNQQHQSHRPKQHQQSRAQVTSIEVRDISVAEAHESREAMLLGSSIKVAPVVQWDQQKIGDGKPGPVSRALLQLLDEDMRSGDRLIDVPY